MKPWDRTATLRKMAPEDVGFDIICFTEEEFAKARRSLQPLVRIR